MTVDPKDVRGFHVLIPCDYCKEEGRIPGGKYQHEGEVVRCPVCNGTRTIRKVISLDELRSLVLDWDPQSQ